MTDRPDPRRAPPWSQPQDPTAFWAASVGVVESVGEHWMKTKRRVAPAGILTNELGGYSRPRVVRDEPSLDPGEPDWDAYLPDAAKTTRWRAGQIVKRGIDIMGAGLGLLALSPLLLVVAFLVKATSRGPLFYRTHYLGERGRPFVGYKFRSMVANADLLKSSLAHLNHMKGPAFKIRNDPRVTPLGRVLRKYSIDELPQLWNVLKGDMSLVGPRPPLPEEFERFRDWHKAKLSVRPGITCYWQINGRSEISDFDQWAHLDLHYIEVWSLWTDLKILLRTVPAVFGGRGAY